MTAPAKKVPAKKVNPRASAKPAMDYSSISADAAQNVDPSQVKGSTGGMLKNTPFVAWMRDSRQNNIGKQFSVPESASEQTQRLLRTAAREVGCGVKIVAAPPANGSVVIAFRAKDKKKVGPRKATA